MIIRKHRKSHSLANHHRRNTLPRKLFLAITLVVFFCAVLATLYALNKKFLPEKDDNFTFGLTQWPEGRSGAVSLIVDGHNVTDTPCYKNTFAALEKYGYKASFFINSDLMRLFADKPNDFVFWSRIKEYAAAGHEIGVSLRLKDIKKADEVLQQADYCKNALKKRFNIDLKSLILPKNSFGSCDINWYWQLEKNGYYINRYNFFRSCFLPPAADPKRANYPIDPAGIGEEAEKNGLWQQVLLPNAYMIKVYSEKATSEYTEKLLQDLKQRNVYIDTFKNLETFRRQRSSAKIVIDQVDQKSFSFHIQGEKDAYSYFIGPQKSFVVDLMSSRNIPDTNLTVYRVKNNTSVYCISTKHLNDAKGISSVTIAEYPNNAQATVVFTFDDTNYYHINDWYPILKKYDLPATFFLNMKPQDDKLWKEFCKIQNDGYEIGCHSYAHMPAHGLLSNLPIEDFRQDLALAQARIKEYNLNVTAYCFPGNYHARHTRNIVGQEFDWYVMNERNSIYPVKAKFKPEIYCNYLMKTAESFVEMIHTPIYRNMNYIDMYKQLFEYLSPIRDKIEISTYSDMRAYAYERHHTDIIYLKTKPNHLKFKLKTNTRPRTSVPLTLNIAPSNLKLLKDPTVKINNKAAAYKIRNGKEITLSAPPGAVVEILR